MKEEFSQHERQLAAEMCWLESNSAVVMPERRTEWIENILTAGEHTHLWNLLRLQCELNLAKGMLQAAIEAANAFALSGELFDKIREYVRTHSV